MKPWDHGPPRKKARGVRTVVKITNACCRGTAGYTVLLVIVVSPCFCHLRNVYKKLRGIFSFLMESGLFKSLGTCLARRTLAGAVGVV